MKRKGEDKREERSEGFDAGRGKEGKIADSQGEIGKRASQRKGIKVDGQLRQR